MPRRTLPLLAGAALLGLGLRLWGLDFGLPLDLRPDEDYFYLVVRRMVETGDLNPHFFSYPGLTFYGLAAWMKFAHLAATIGAPASVAPSFAEFVADRTTMVRVQRMIAALLGTATIPLIFLVGRLLGGRRVGIGAALLLAVCYLHVRHSHFGVADVPAVFFATLALGSILHAGRTGSLRAFLAAGAAAGLASGVRYTSALLALPIVLVAFEAARAGSPGRWLGGAMRLIAAAAVAMVLVFLITAPYTVLAWDEFAAAFPGQTDVRVGWFGAGSLIGHLTTSLRYGLGLPALALALAGCVTAWSGRRPGWTALLAFGAANLALLAFSDRVFARYALPLVPVVLLLAADAAREAGERLPARARVPATALLLLLAVLPSLHRALVSDYLFSRPSSLNRLSVWLESEAPPGARLAFTSPLIADRVLPVIPKVPYDPLRMLYGEAPTYLVEMSHPLGFVESPAGVDRLLASSSSWRTVFSVEALDERALESAVFDTEDAFFYPLAGFSGVALGGPNVAVHRVEPGPPPQRSLSAEPPPRGLSAFPYGEGIAARWEPAATGSPLGWYVRVATVEAFRGGPPPVPVALPAGRLGYGTGALPPGRYLVAVSPVGPGGEGEPTISGPIELPPR